MLKDLTPVGMAAFSGAAIAVPVDQPIHNVADLVKASKEQQGGLSFSHPGIGNQMHLAGEMLKSQTGANLVGIPYRGNGPAVAALLTGDVQVSISDLVSLMPLAADNKIRLIAVTNKQRQKVLPNVPTVIEQGFPNYSADAWVGMMAPAGTPPEIVNRLNAELGRIMALPDVQQAFAKLGLETTSMTPDEMRKFVTEDHARWGKIIKDNSVKIE